MTSACGIVAGKELLDHLRDRRSLVSFVGHAAMGPAIVLLVSFSSVAHQKSLPVVLVGLLSVFALVSGFAGAVHVAMDVMSGERERRSLLPLLTTPVSRRDLVIGKWIAVSVFGLGALGVNLAGVVVVLALRTPATLLSHLVTLVAWGLLGLAPLALLGSAIQVWVASLSPTMKEAGTSLMMVVFAPMIVGMVMVFYPIGGGWWRAVPIVGQQLLIQSGLGGGPVSVASILALTATTLVSALVPLALTERILSRDDVCRA